MMMNGNVVWGRSVARHFVLCVCANLISWGLTHPSWGQDSSMLETPLATGQSQPPETAPADRHATASAESLSRAFRQASARVLPTVVTIRTAANASVRENPFRGTPWEDLFEGGGSRMPRREGLGSGVIIDAKGVILTNNHVVAESDRVEVQLSDGRVFPARDIQTDPETDLAVVRIDAPSNLPTAVLGDSDALQIGDWVLAIGSPFGLDATVSAGIISAKGRSLSTAERAPLLQTDAAINPGNSGGPLVNLNGEVVGINSSIATRTGAYQGIGFAIPANLAKWVSGQLVQDGHVRRAYLGVGVASMNADVAEQMGVDVGKGVVVMNVYPGSPAHKVGLRLGDIITHFEQTPIATPAELQQSVEKREVGSRIRLAYLREGREQVVGVTLEQLPEDVSRAGNGTRAPQRPSSPRSEAEAVLGIEVQDLTERLGRELGYEDRTAGVLVVSVDPDSVAADKGIGPGMLILRVGKKDVLNVDQFRQAVAGESVENGILLLVATPSESRFLVLKKY